jgi:hypothetical protein
MVTSGAVAFGKQKMAQELLMSLSMRETLSPKDHTRQVRSICCGNQFCSVIWNRAFQHYLLQLTAAAAVN